MNSRTLGRMAWKALRVFVFLVTVIGSLVGFIIGTGYLIFFIDKRFHWGEIGIALMVLLVALALASIMVAITEGSNSGDD